MHPTYPMATMIQAVFLKQIKKILHALNASQHAS
jgi:hypothetical protein